MKANILRSKALLVIIFIIPLFSANGLMAQRKYKIFPYAELKLGYGNMFERYEYVTQGQTGLVPAKARESHFNGFNGEILIGGTLSDSKYVSKYSYFDFFATHRQLHHIESSIFFTGGGLQGRNQRVSANIVMGWITSGNEIPDDRDNKYVMGYSYLKDITFGFGIGANLPWEKRSNLILTWDMDFLFPKNVSDELDSFIRYTWFSTTIGAKYYLTRIR